MKSRITLTLDEQLVAALDQVGPNRSQTIERLLGEALAARAHGHWVRELESFYRAGRPEAEREDDDAWQALVSEAFGRDE